MKKQNFIYGSFILILSAVITKLIGALFKIPITNLLGGTGMGYFSAAYGLFMPIYAISVTGIPTAIAKLTAENAARNNTSNIRKIKYISLVFFSCTGIILSLIIFLCSYPFCRYVIETPEAFPAVFIIAPSIFFGCVMSVYRGYYEGLRNMYPTAISQVIEALVKFILGLGLCYFTINFGVNNPDKFLKVVKYLGVDIIESNAKSTYDIIISYSAAAAVLGVTLSSFVGMIYLIIKSKFTHDTQSEIFDKNVHSSKSILKNIISIVIPVAIGSLVTNLTSLIDLATIIKFINISIDNNPQFYSEFNMPLNDVANFFYGSFTGLSVTVFNLVPSITNMFGKGILPNMTEAWTQKDMVKIKKSIISVFTITSLVAIPAGIGISFLSEEILTFLFSSKTQEIIITSKSLLYLGIGVIFLSMSSPVFSMFQSIGKSYIPVKLMIIGVIIKLLGNIILIPIPSLNINGAAISTTLCYIVIFILSVIFIIKETGIRFNIFKIIMKPVYSSFMCAITAKIIYDNTVTKFGNKISLIIGIFAGCIVYFVLLYLLNYLKKENIKSFL